MKKIILLLVVIMASFVMCKKDKKSSVPNLTTNSISDLTSTSAKTGGMITDDGGSAISKKGVCWATHSDPTVADSISNDGSGTSSFITTLNALLANTTYYVKAYAINATGTAYGNEISFKTPAGLAAVKTNAITDIVALSANGGGEVTNDGGAPVTERGIVYATTQNPTTANFKVISGSGAGTFTATMSPLSSQQTYYVRAFAINNYGTAYGNQVQFNAAPANTVTDIDGNVYPYVSICGKDWMAANLKTTKYKNGDPISDGSIANYNWVTNTNGAYTYPNGDIANNNTYGKLYNVESMKDSRGVCPAGWHVATDIDWQAAEVCEGMNSSTANTVGDRCCGGLKFLEGGSSGVQIKKAGYLFVDQSTGAQTWSVFNISGYYWTSTESAAIPGSYRTRVFSRTSAPDADYINRQTLGRANIMAIRCVKD
jgi:uncharacterized protein (TIGR02145 family)